MGDIFEAVLRTAWAQCWQVTLLIVAVWLVVKCVARNRPHLACVLWLVVLIKCLTPPLWSSPSSVFSWLQSQRTVQLDAQYPIPLPMERRSNPGVDVAVRMPRVMDTSDRQIGQSALLIPRSKPSYLAQLIRQLSSWRGVLVLTWLLGCVGFSLIAIARLMLCLSRLQRAGTVDAPEVAQLAQNLGSRLGLKRPVRVIVSRSPVGPAVVGIFRPTVILPSLIVNTKTLTQLEPLLAHELIHIRRGDLWVGILQLVARGLWWFHPLVRWSNDWLTRDAERCCDEEVIAHLGCEPGQYARSLLDVLALKRMLYSVPAFPGVRPVDVTSQRLERIMKLGQGCHKRTPRWCWLVMLLAISATLPGAALMIADEKPLAAPVAAPKVYIEPDHQAMAGLNVKEMSAEAFVTCVYHVEDLLQRYRKEVEDQDVAAREMVEHLLQSAIRSHFSKPIVESNTTHDADQESVAGTDCHFRWDQARLLVRSRSAAHGVIAQELKRLREDGFTAVEVSVRMISGKAANFEAAQLNWKLLDFVKDAVVANAATSVPQPPTPEPRDEAALEAAASNEPHSSSSIQDDSNAVLQKYRFSRIAIVSSVRAEELVKQAQADPRANLLHAPKISVFSGRSASISDQLIRPFVVAYERQNDESKPVVRNLVDGWSMQVSPRLLDEKQNLFSIRLDISTSSIIDVKTATFPADKRGPSVSVQCPEVAAARMVTSLQLNSDQTVVVGNLDQRAAGNAEEPRLLLINVRRGDSKHARVKVRDIPVEAIRQVPVVEVPGSFDKQLANLAKDFARREKKLGYGPDNVSTDPNTLETRVYNVADLVIPLPQFSSSPVEVEKPVSESSKPEQSKLDFTTLLEMITKTVEPKSWDINGGRGSAKPFNTTISLVVSQTPAVHDQLARLLERMRTFQDLQVTFQVESITLTEAEVEQWLEKTNCPGVQKLKSGTGSGAFPISSLATTWIRKFCGAGVQTGPKVTLMNGQQSEIPLDLLDRKSTRCISSLHLLPIVSPTFEKLHVKITRGQFGDKSGNPRLDFATLGRGEALLIDMAERSWKDVVTNIPILDQLPSLGRVFQSSPSTAQTGSRQFYLISPKILLVQEYELHD